MCHVAVALAGGRSLGAKPKPLQWLQVVQAYGQISADIMTNEASECSKHPVEKHMLGLNFG
jgi:hypothetical protein